MVELTALPCGGRKPSNERKHVATVYALTSDAEEPQSEKHTHAAGRGTHGVITMFATAETSDKRKDVNCTRYITGENENRTLDVCHDMWREGLSPI